MPHPPQVPTDDPVGVRRAVTKIDHCGVIYNEQLETTEEMLSKLCCVSLMGYHAVTKT